MKGRARTLPQKGRKIKRRSQDPPIKKEVKEWGAVSTSERKHTTKQERRGAMPGVPLTDNKNKRT